MGLSNQCVRLVPLIAVASTVIGGCDSKTGPDLRQAVQLSVTGPVLLAPGQAAQYTATERLSDGSLRDVTGVASWLPGTDCPGCPLYFPSRGGVGVAVRSGGQPVMVSYREPSTLATPTLRAELAVDILLPGTFKLTGTLTQAGGGPIAARVEVLSGIGQGLTASGFGSYALYGLSGPAQLRASVSSEDFIAQVKDVVVNGPGVTQDFALSPTEPSADVSGDWTLTFVGPSSSCPAGFPAVARNRTYRLRLTQHGTSLGVVITAPSLQVIEPENVSGSVHGARVQIGLADNLNDFTGALSPNFFDHISPTDTFSFGGDVTGTANEPEIAAVFTGTLRYWPGSTQSTPLWSCSAADHQVTLRR